MSTANRHDIVGGGPEPISTPTYTPNSKSVSETHAWQHVEQAWATVLVGDPTLRSRAFLESTATGEYVGTLAGATHRTAQEVAEVLKRAVSTEIVVGGAHFHMASDAVEMMTEAQRALDESASRGQVAVISHGLPLHRE